MKKLFLINMTGILLFASVCFTGCSDDGGAKSSSNMTPVVKVDTRGSVNPPEEKGGSQQRSAQSEGGYYNFVADQTPPSANVISRAAFSTGGKWAYMEQGTAKAQCV